MQPQALGCEYSNTQGCAAQIPGGRASPTGCAPPHVFTVMFTDSIAAFPDFWNGRGIGWALPFSSSVRQRNVYSPTASPGSSTAQCTFVSFIGHVRGLPVTSSKPIVPARILPSGRAPQRLGGGRISASDQGAVMKYGSPAGR